MERTIDLFTYICVDGMVRTRCEAHIAHTGPYRLLVKPYHVRHGVAWQRCVECHAEYLKQLDKREDGNDE